ncbi:class I SAM-dependent RNA methyltransferase [Pseudoruegeria sp. HB172150]|uniref:THUMP domain-containing class I SAM-dependent RNA methyltransferase n=1 Tax=Pseudoruegeria sp. HB172150 TaxID=2721164 RepID=UPI001554E2F1|nr:class I SAM-dependent RNA methyltransferase [Pseudoruegeria sp. HB172150]
MTTGDFEIFLAAPPGLEPVLAEEARAEGFALPRPVPGGVETRGGWSEVWRANLVLRGASRVLVRIGEFRAFHLAQLDKRARKFPWGDYLRPDVPVKVEVATNRKSKIYHAGAAAQRLERAIADTLGAPIGEDGVTLKARIEDNLVILSLDSSGEPLHRRGHKQAVSKAPMRETLAALFLRQCGYDGTEPVLDPMCGSGTFPIEAAEIAAGLLPGRTRSFAFERFAGFDAEAWAHLKTTGTIRTPGVLFHGSDRDQGAIRMAAENAERSGVAAWTRFDCRSVADLERPDGPPGLVMVNPPYGARIGNKKLLFGVYAQLGEVLKARFSGWRVGMVTSEKALATASGLPFLPTGAPVPHGGLKVVLYRTGVLG